MRYLTTYIDDEVNFKFGNTGSLLKLKAIDNYEVSSFSKEQDLKIRVKNETVYLKTVDVVGDGREILLPTSDLASLPVGQYDLELWVTTDKGKVIYPDVGFLKLNINGNTTQATGKLLSSLTLADFENEIECMLKKADEEVKKRIDSIVTDRKKVPEITISSKGTLVINGVDTDFYMRGEKGDSGNDGLSSYELAKKNGFIGNEKDWINSLKGDTGDRGLDGKSTYQIWLDLGNTGSEQDFINSLKPKENSETTTRHAPTAWTLDRTTTPWTIWFDNGCGLQFPEYATTTTIYGYGFASNPNTTDFSSFPLVQNIMGVTRGVITVEKFRTKIGTFDYWAPTTKVLNPLQDASKYDWLNAFGDAGTNSSSYGRKPVFARVMYELGIWSDNDVLSLGAIRKEE